MNELRTDHLVTHGVEGGKIRPLLATTWPFGEIAIAKEAFGLTDFVGNIVLIPSEGVAGWHLAS